MAYLPTDTTEKGNQEELMERTTENATTEQRGEKETRDRKAREVLVG